MTVEDMLRMIAPALGRRRVQRGLRWARNPNGSTRYSDTFLVAHGLMPDEITSKGILDFLWAEAQAPSPLHFARQQQAA